VSITFIDRDGDEQTVQAKIGDTLLEVAKEFDIDVEGLCTTGQILSLYKTMRGSLDGRGFLDIGPAFALYQPLLAMVKH